MNTISKIKVSLLSAAMVLMAASCAESPTINSNDDAKLHFDAWISENYPGVTPTDLGVYIIGDTPGTGEAIGEEDYYIFVTYTETDLDGNVTSTSDKALAQQVGTYEQANYYGANVLIKSAYETYSGLLDMLDGMRVGGTRTAVIPGWLTTTNYYETAEEYFNNCTGTNTIATYTVVDKTDDIIQWEVDTLERYTHKYMKQIDSTIYGYYYLQLTPPSDTTTFPDDTTFWINYTGRLLNGQVFDTTIEDTAKVYGLYSSSNTYSPVYITKNETYTEITLASSESSTGSNVVDGFAYCLSNLKSFEKGVCAFYSTMGYGYSGNGSKVPRFAPLVFEIEVVSEPED